MEKRLIRKDTPHYKKHFKITKLPKPEAVAALLQGFSPDALNSSAQAAEDEEDEEEEQSDGTPQHRHRVEEAEDSRHQVNSSQVKVKERSKHWQGAVQECRKCYISSQQDMQYTPSQHILGFKTLHIYFSLFVASLQTFDIVCMESLCHLASCIHLRWMWRCMQGHSWHEAALPLCYKSRVMHYIHRKLTNSLIWPPQILPLLACSPTESMQTCRHKSATGHCDPLFPYKTAFRSLSKPFFFLCG